MINLLLQSILLILLITISYIINKNILSPSFIMATLFEFVTIVSIALYDSIEKDISIKTLFIVSIAIIAILLGECFAKFIGSKVKKTKISNEINVINISNVWVFLSCIFCLVVFLLRMKTLREFSIENSLQNGIDSLRMYYTKGLISTNRIVIWMTYATQALSFIFITSFAYNYIYLKRVYIKYLLPILTYFMVEYSTTGRTGYLQFFSFSFVIFAFFYLNKYKNNKSKSSFKIIKIAIITSILIGGVFWLYGIFVRKIDSNFVDTLVPYISGGLYGLDSYINNPWPKNEVIGANTLRNIYLTLTTFGFEFNLPEYHLPFYNNGKVISNIYTGFVIPMHDFGIIFFFLSRVLLGYMYTKFLSYIINLSIKEIYKKIYLVIILADLWYPIVFSFIADRYLNYLDLSYVLIVAFIFIFSKLFKIKIKIKIMK